LKQALKDAATERQQLEAQLSACKQRLSNAQASLKAAREELEELKTVHTSACQQMSTERQQVSDV
jgi:chromosome segregation ATPase